MINTNLYIIRFNQLRTLKILIIPIIFIIFINIFSIIFAIVFQNEIPSLLFMLK